VSHVDTTSPITHVSLCAGYGGIDLGLHRAIRNLRTIAVSEIEAFACANLVAKMEAGLLDPAPIWTDLKTFPWSDFRDRVDILSGGYPCQPFSAAGKRLGAEDPRHLWPFIADGIAAMRPSVCFFENVEGHISLGLSDVLQDLVGLGYRATWCVASASECGAPHQRKRIFILAYDAHGEQRAWSLLRQNWQGSAVSLGRGSGRAEELALTSSLRSAAGFPRPQQGHEGIAGVADHCGDQGCGELANAQLHGRDYANARPNADGIQGPLGQEHEHRQALGDGQLWPSRPGEQQFAWEPPRVVGNAASPRRPRPEDTGADCGDESQGTWREESERAGAMGNPNSPRPQERPRQRGAGVQGADADGGETADREVEFSMGDPAYGTPDGLGVAELSGLSDQELAEIRHWMVASDNRTDELRLLGNGVVPACAERAFRLLVGELMEHQP